MASGVAHTLRVWLALWRVRVLHELHYRVNFVINVAQVMIDLVIGYIAIRLVTRNIDDLNGWTEPQLLIVLGVFTMVDAFVRAVVLPNMFLLVQDVREGSFDGVLLMPADDQLFVTARELSVWDLSGLVLGAGVAAIGVSRTGGVGLADVVTGVLLLPSALAIIYSFFLAVTSIVFRLVDLGDLLFRLYQGSYSGRWPLGIYPGWLRVALTAIVPMAVAVTIPAAALAGRLEARDVAVAVVVAAVLIVGSRRVFRRQLRHYSGASA